MATVTLRPDSASGTNFSPADFLENIQDNDPDTGATQTATSAVMTGTFANSSDYSGATITQVRMTVQASTAGKADECGITADLIDSDDQLVQRDSLDFTSANEEQACTAVTSGLNSSYIDGLTFQLTPNEAGCIVKEVFIVVTFTVATPDPNPAYVLLNSGKYKITAGKVKIL